MSVSSGPNISYDSGYTIHTFLESGTFTPNFTGTVEVLVVAGGGGGGMDMGGGGGGGGVISNTAYAVTAGTPITVTVGLGGRGGPAATTGISSTFGQPVTHQYTQSATSGGNSVFGTITAIGGGYGASSVFSYTPNYGQGGSGGSGGGASGYNNNATTPGTLYGYGTAGQGNNGGGCGTAYYSGGGGGAGAAGVSGNSQPNGGDGILNSILGIPYYWGAGGGGSAYSAGSGGNGGKGGGGGGAVGAGGLGGTGGINPGKNGTAGSNNAWANVPGGDAGEHTGSGGGGGSHYNATNQGGSGGSGIVVVKYLSSLGASGGSNSSGLIFSIDAGNRKSWSGSGADRIGGITAAFGSWGGLTGTTTAYTAPNGAQGVYLNTIAGGGVNYWNSVLSTQPCLSSTQYIVSAKIKYSGATPSANLFYVRQFSSGMAQTSENGKYTSAQQIDLGDGWYYAWAYFTTDATAVFFYVHGYEYSGGMNLWVEDMQCKLAGMTDICASGAVASMNGPTADLNNKYLSFAGAAGQFINVYREGLNAGSWAYPQATIISWLYIDPTSTTAQNNIFTAESAIEVCWTNNNNGTATIQFAGNPWAWLGTAVVPTGQWMMLTYRHGTSTGDIIQNTTVLNAIGISGGLQLGTASYPMLTLMGRTGGTAAFAKGRLSQFQIYGRALSNSEISQLFNSQRGRYGL